MQLTLNKMSALRVMRALRSGALASALPLSRCGILAPDPAPWQRWTSSHLDLGPLGPYARPDDRHPLDVAVGDKADVLRTSAASCTVYSTGLPDGSFVSLGEGIAISGPELLFVELSRVLALPQLVLLGMELCGTFSRDALDPRDGPVTYFVDPLTSVADIERFCREAHGLWGLTKAREALALVRDNAWSPMEAVVATMLLLPFGELGYELPGLVLNPRTPTPVALVGVTAHASRVPDMLLDGCGIGLNYDGQGHLDLESVVDAATQAALAPADARAARTLEQVTRNVREKVVDDLRRTRELAASGLTVLVVTKEDLYEQDGLDAVVTQLVEVARREGTELLPFEGLLNRGTAVASARQKLLWSLLPGRRGRVLARMLADKKKRTFVSFVVEEWVVFEDRCKGTEK